MDALTETQARVLNALRQRIEIGELPPSYRALCSEFGWSSTATARDHLQALERKGFIQLPRHRGGRLKVHHKLPPADCAPLVGQIVAGTPVMADEHCDGLLPFPTEWSGGAKCFALRVIGDSMVDAGIFDGDHVIVRQQNTANNGDIVAATIDSETTLKRYVSEGPYALLAPANSRYEAIKVTTQSVLLHGVVVGLLRAYTASPPGPSFQDPGETPHQMGGSHAHRT